MNFFEKFIPKTKAGALGAAIGSLIGVALLVGVTLLLRARGLSLEDLPEHATVVLLSAPALITGIIGWYIDVKQEVTVSLQRDQAKHKREYNERDLKEDMIGWRQALKKEIDRRFEKYVVAGESKKRSQETQKKSDLQIRTEWVFENVIIRIIDDQRVDAAITKRDLRTLHLILEELEVDYAQVEKETVNIEVTELDKAKATEIIWRERQRLKAERERRKQRLVSAGVEEDGLQIEDGEYEKDIEFISRK